MYCTGKLIKGATLLAARDAQAPEIRQSHHVDFVLSANFSSEGNENKKLGCDMADRCHVIEIPPHSVSSINAHGTILSLSFPALYSCVSLRFPESTSCICTQGENP